MRELLRAPQIRDSVVKLDEQIINLEKKIDLIIANDSTGAISLSFNTPTPKKENTPEGDTLNQDTILTGAPIFIMEVARNSRGHFEHNISRENLNSKDYEKGEYAADLNASELVLVLATLLRYKQDVRKELVLVLATLLRYKQDVRKELVLVLATLLRYKQDVRKELVNEFNNLNLKLKL